jgi:uncharacterized repeat protein (TIGR01451 family)
VSGRVPLLPLLVAAGVLLGPVPAAAAAPAGPTAAAPALRISVTNGRTEARPGDRMRYTIEIRNTGTVGIPALAVSQSVPPGLRVLDADRGGAVRSGQVRWTVALRPGRAERFSTTATVGATPATTLRLATVACATLSGATVPAVCATHSDQLPAAAVGGPPAAPAAPGHRGLIAAGAAAGLAALLGLVLLAVRRRPGAGPGAPPGDRPEPA